MTDASRRPRARDARCCICSSTIEKKPAQLVVYWRERAEPIALDAHASCLEPRPPAS